MKNYEILISYQTDGFDFERDLKGICAELRKVFPKIARPYVLLKRHKVTGRIPNPKPKKSKRP